MRDFSECLLSSFDGGKRKLLDIKFLDFDMFISVVDEDLFSNFVLYEFFFYSREVESGFFCFYIFFLVKIKLEIELSYEDESVFKKLRVEGEEYLDIVESDE